MKVLYLTNNEISYSLYEWIKINIKGRCELFEEKLNAKVILDYSPDLIISYNYHHIIGKEAINLMRNRIINLHISLLPWNKGTYPNIWSLIENTPKGVSIAYIDEGIDTGDILCNKKVYFDETKETLKSTYNILHNEVQDLFKAYWDEIKDNKIIPIKQQWEGSFHNDKDFTRLRSLLNLDDWNINICDLKERYIALNK